MNFFLPGASFMTTYRVNIQGTLNSIQFHTLTNFDGKTNNQKTQNKETLTKKERQNNYNYSYHH